MPRKTLSGSGVSVVMAVVLMAAQLRSQFARVMAVQAFRNDPTFCNLGPGVNDAR